MSNARYPYNSYEEYRNQSYAKPKKNVNGTSSVSENDQSQQPMRVSDTKKRKDKSHREQGRKSYPMRRRVLESSSSSQHMEDEEPTHEYKSDHVDLVQKYTGSLIQTPKLTDKATEERVQMSSGGETVCTERSANTDSESEREESRTWNFRLRREDMASFSEIESKLFRRLLRKVIRNNGQVVTTVEKKTEKEQQDESKRNASNYAIDQSNNTAVAPSPVKRVKRKRKIITRRDKNGVILEKIYKPYDGDETSKEDIIVKYENGQPVGSFTPAQLEEFNLKQNDDKEKSVNLSDFTNESEIDTSETKSALKSHATIEIEPSDILIGNSDLKTEKSSELTIGSVQSDTSEKEKSVTQIEATISENKGSRLEVSNLPNKGSQEVGIKDTTAHGESAVKGDHAAASVEKEKQRIQKAKVSSRTKLITSRREEKGSGIQFDYYHSAAGGSSPCRLLQFLVHLQKQKQQQQAKATEDDSNKNQDENEEGKYLDAYKCLDVAQSVLKLKPYRDELSSSSGDENQDEDKPEDETNTWPENNLKSQPDLGEADSKHGGSNMSDQTAGSKNQKSDAKSYKSEKRTACKPKKPKQAKGRKRKSKIDTGMDSDEEKAKSIVDKLVKKFKVERDDEDKSGTGSRPTLKLSHAMTQMFEGRNKKDFNVEVTYPPGAERASHVIQYEFNSNYFTTPIPFELWKRIDELGINLKACFCCNETGNKYKGVLYGPYNFKKEWPSEEPVTSSEGFSDVLSIWIHEECLLKSPDVCLIGSRLLGLQELIEAKLDPLSSEKESFI